MSSSESAQPPTVLLVAADRDPTLIAFANHLSERGAFVQHASNVYEAMGLLARGLPTHHAVVDVRQLDEHEGAFLRLAPRYYAGLCILAPLLEGTVAQDGDLASGVSVLPPADLVEYIFGIPFAVSAEPFAGPVEESAEASEADEWASDVDEAGVEEANEETAAPRASSPIDAPLSTDGGVETNGDAPGMYEAVRERMGADFSAPVRRKPPSRTPPPAVEETHVENPPAESGEPQEAGSGRLSRDELDALLGDKSESESTQDDGGLA